MPIIPIDQFVRKRGTFAPVPRNEGTPPVEQPGLLGSAFSLCVATVRSDFTATAGLIAETFGYDEAAQGFYNRAHELAQERDQIQRRV